MIHKKLAYSASTFVLAMSLSGVLTGCGKTKIIEKPVESRDVIITTSEPDPRVCTYINDVETDHKHRDLAKAHVAARQKMKNRAVELRGNTVILDTDIWDDPGLFDRAQVVLTGRVFDCQRDDPRNNQQQDNLDQDGDQNGPRLRTGQAEALDPYEEALRQQELQNVEPLN